MGTRSQLARDCAHEQSLSATDMLGRIWTVHNILHSSAPKMPGTDWSRPPRAHHEPTPLSLADPSQLAWASTRSRTFRHVPLRQIFLLSESHRSNVSASPNRRRLSTAVVSRGHYGQTRTSLFFSQLRGRAGLSTLVSCESSLRRVRISIGNPSCPRPTTRRW